MPPSASPSSSVSQPAPAPALPTSSSATSTISAASAALSTQPQPRSVSQPVAPPPAPQSIQMPQQMPLRSATLAPQQQPQQRQQQQQLPNNPVWNDLAQLQAPATNSSLPLQFAPSPATQPINIPNASGLSAPNQFTGLSASPNNLFPSSLGQQPVGMFPGGTPRSMSLNTGMSNMSLGGANPGLGMSGVSPSMFPSQGTMGGGLGAPSSLLPQNTTPSPFGAPSSLPSANLGLSQPSFAPSSFGQQSQPLLTPQPQQQPQASPMFQPQPLGQMQGSQMFQSPPLGQPPMGNPSPNPFGLAPMQGSPQPGITPFSSPQPQFGGSPSPAAFMQQQQPQFAQPNAGLGMNMGMGGMQGMGGMPSNAFGGTGWGQPTGYPGQQQQQWNRM